jgi:hypothetical protein
MAASVGGLVFGGPEPLVRYWHKADIEDPPSNVRFGVRADITTLDPRQDARRGEIDQHYFPPMRIIPGRTGRT